MKIAKIITILSFFLFISTAVNAQETKEKKPTINSSKKESNKIVHKGVDYYIIDGMWYAKFKKRYVFKTAPKGAKVPFKPGKGVMVTMGGKKYFKCNGIFYKKLKPDLYEVVRL